MNRSMLEDVTGREILVSKDTDELMVRFGTDGYLRDVRNRDGWLMLTFFRPSNVIRIFNSSNYDSVRLGFDDIFDYQLRMAVGEETLQRCPRERFDRTLGMDPTGECFESLLFLVPRTTKNMRRALLSTIESRRPLSVKCMGDVLLKCSASPELMQ